MPKIIGIEGSKVKIGNEDGKVTTAPVASLTFANPKIGDQVEVFKDGNNLIINKTKSAKGAKMSGVKISKKVWMIGGGVLTAVILVVCGICFLPGMLDKDLSTPSTYPKYYKNLKEEKEAFANALEACNRAAESKMKSNGIKTEYQWDDIDAVSKNVYEDEDSGATTIILSRVKPTGGDTEYKTSYGSTNVRDYDCETNLSGTSVQDISILWSEKNE